MNGAADTADAAGAAGDDAADVADNAVADADERALLLCVEAGLARLETGATVDLDALCAAHPHLRRAVAEALGLGSMLTALHRQSGDGNLGSEVGGRYRLEQRIGQGAMGTVYRAHDRELGRRVAVKLLEPALFRGPETLRRFTREAEVLARLRHRHVVMVHDRGIAADGTPFLVAELLHGASLAELLRVAAERVPPGGSAEAVAFAEASFVAAVVGAPAAAAAGTEAKAGAGTEPGDGVPERSWLRCAVRWCAQVAAGLEAAHAQGICHRDVKPSNVFVGRDGAAVLLDFGVASCMGGDGHGGDGAATLPGTTLGTPWYMAPEQARGDATPAPTLDVWGLGATLYHLLALAPPYEGDAGKVLAALQVRDPRPLATRLPRAPSDLRAILDKALEREPRRRYPSAAAMREDLEAFLGHRPVSARPLGRAARLWRAARRRPARAFAVAAAALALLLAAVAVPLWAEQRRAARLGEWQERSATVPALLALEAYPDLRLLEDVSERREALALLDRLLVLAPDDHPSRLLRGALRLDGGDHAAAAADLRLLAAAAGTPYARAVAERYLAADGSRAGALAVNTADLPEPRTDLDCFVAGFHSLRLRRPEGYERAEQLLRRAAVSYRPARDLRLIALLALADAAADPDRAAALATAARDEALRLEEAYGRATARTQHVIGAACLHLDRPREAIPYLLEAIRLRPGRHGPLQNLGVAHFMLGELDEAELWLSRAHEVRPWLWNTLYVLSRVAEERGDFAAALRHAERIPTAGTMGEAWKRPYRIAGVHVAQAIAAFESGDAAAAAAAARAALPHCELAAANGGPGYVLDALLAVARAYTDQDPSRAFAGQLAALRLQPRDARNVWRLALALDEVRATGRTLSVRELTELQDWLLSLSLDLAPGLADARRALERLRARVAAQDAAGVRVTGGEQDVSGNDEKR